MPWGGGGGERHLNFYIFKGKQMRKITYINMRHVLPWQCNTIQNMDDDFSFHNVNCTLFTLCAIKGSNLCLANKHLLILDGHNSHVSFDVVMQMQRFNWDLLTLLFHTSHALQLGLLLQEL